VSPRPSVPQPIRINVIRARSGRIGQIIGHDREILWECPPRSDGKDDPRGGAHHQPHDTDGAARACAQRELERGQAEGLYP